MKLRLVGRASYAIAGHPLLHDGVVLGQAFEVDDVFAKDLLYSCPGLFEVVPEAASAPQPGDAMAAAPEAPDADRQEKPKRSAPRKSK